MGDFNERLQEMADLLDQRGLRGVLPPGIATHRQGNQLDQLFTNMSVKGWMATDVEYSDHLMLRVTLEFERLDTDVDIRRMPTVITQQSIRQAAMS